VISRRHLLTATAAGAASTLLGSSPVSAGSANVLVEDATRRRFGPVLFIGDSTSSRHWSRLDNVLAEHEVGPYRCDLQPGRSISREFKRFPSAVRAVQDARSRGFDPQAVVVALGANDLGYATESHENFTDLTDTLFREIGPNRAIGFFNIYATVPTKARYFNAWLEEARTSWPNLIVLDWASLARRHRRWHQDDGFHYNYEGAEARNSFVARAMVNTVLFASARLQRWPAGQ
jgi:hypothetical protein